MDSYLAKIRDLIIIIGIYLYFIAWVYIHFYYQQFGLSTEALKIDYSSYLVYSYTVLSSPLFLIYFLSFLVIVLLRKVILFSANHLKDRNSFFKNLNSNLNENVISVSLKNNSNRYFLLIIIAFLILIFPLLFKIARETALENYFQDRTDARSLKSIQFIFRKDADLISPTIILDSILSKKHIFYSDLSLIKNDTTHALKLLGESDAYYIVLNQPPFDKAVKALPSGYIYFINKKDILLTKINLNSF